MDRAFQVKMTFDSRWELPPQTLLLHRTIAFRTWRRIDAEGYCRIRIEHSA
jgi:hypothetical protein